MAEHVRPSRRAFLHLAGGGVALACGGVAWRARSTGVLRAPTGAAYAPWDWRTGSRDPGELVRAAVLAASPMNAQPWLFTVGDGLLELHTDLERHTGTLDPLLREMTLGLGCALENMLLTARTVGYDVSLRLDQGRLNGFPAIPVAIRVASLELAPGRPRPSVVQKAIVKRRTDRGRYAPQPLAEQVVSKVRSLGSDGAAVRVYLFPRGDDRHLSFEELLYDATRWLAADSEVAGDWTRWLRTRDQAMALADGMTEDTSGAGAIPLAWRKMMPRPSPTTALERWRSDTESIQLPSAAALGLIAVRNRRDRPQVLRAGRTWQWLHLWATNERLAVQPLSQALRRADLEEVRRMASKTRRALGALVDPGWEPVHAFRIGLPTATAAPSPRRAATDVIATTGLPARPR